MTPPGRAHFLLLSLFIAPVRSSLVNITVDDKFGDPTTGSIPKYSAAWASGSPTGSCQACRLNTSNLDLTQVHRQTWHDTTYRPSEAPATITVHFAGSALYVFNILPNMVPGAVTFADISFSIDGEDVGAFTRSPDSSSTILYNQLVYHNTALDYGAHTLIMTPGNNSLTLFDYLVYTAQSNDDTPPPASSTMPTSTSAFGTSSQSPSSSPAGPSTSTSDNKTQSSSFSTISSTSIPYGPSQSSSFSASASAGPPHGSSPSTSSSALISTRGPDDSSQSPSSGTPAGAVVGAVLGGITFLGVVLGVYFLCRRRIPSRPRQSLFSIAARDGGYESGCDSHGSDGVSFASMVSTTPISPMRLFDGAATHRDNPPDLTPDVLTPESARTSLRIVIPASQSMNLEEGEAQHCAELAPRLATLQRTRSETILSSPDPTDPSRLEPNDGRGTDPETVIRGLEAENAHLHAILIAMNARLAGQYHEDSRSELLPAYTAE